MTRLSSADAETDDSLAQRLSGLLRVAYTEAGAAFDPKQQRAQLTLWLEAQRTHSDSGNSGSSQALSWSGLTGGLPESTSGYAAHERHYRSYLAAVSAAIGGQAPPEELAHAASTAFRCLQACALAEPESAAPAPAPAEARARLQRARLWLSGRGSAAAEASRAAGSVFGSDGPPDDPLRRMLAAHAPLHRWLRTHRQGGAPAGPASRRAPGNGGHGASLFGSELAVAPCVGASSARGVVGDAWLRAFAEALPDDDDDDDEYGFVDAPEVSAAAPPPRPAAAASARWSLRSAAIYASIYIYTYIYRVRPIPLI